jgi:tRNA G18 (ribose-2'-O)-methylase SpoU
MCVRVCVRSRRDAVWLALDEVQDPQNLGAILRR